MIITLEDFMKLYKAETEKELSELIVKLKMDDEKYWIPYGGNESNFSVIGNQSSNAERALIEKFTNCVDAVLMEKCYELGIDPKGKDAPKCPREALEMFFGIKNGDTHEITKEIEKRLGENIMLIATNKECKPNEKKSRNNPNMIVFDMGEGQTPVRLPETILSLLKGNKKSIPFTQGNYNQGGSGALMYCGEYGYCLIISKRNINIPDKFIDKEDHTKDKWGWTLIRKEIRKDSKDPVYTYFAPDGQVPTLDEEELSLLPKELDRKESMEYLNYSGACKGFIPYSKSVKCGTAIKLYNYKLAKKGPVNGHLKYDLASFINDTYLPIRFVDCRKNKASNNIYFRGFKKIIEEDERSKESQEEGLVHNRIDVDFKVCDQQVVSHIYCCNKRKAGSLTAKSLIDGSKAIKFCLGQQFQGGLTARFVNSAGLGAIQDYIIIIVEFPNISTKFRSDLFMTDRERLYDKAPKKAIEKKLKDIIAKSEELREFRKYIIKVSHTDNEKNNNTIRQIMEEWVDKDPTITELLLGNNIFNNNSNEVLENGDGDIDLDEQKQRKNIGGKGGSQSQPSDEIETNYYPTYFRPILKSDEAGIYHKNAYINERFRIRFETDADDDFFIRPKNAGIIKVAINGKETDDFSKIIKNGKATIIFSDKIAGKNVESKDIDITLEYDEEAHFKELVELELKDRPTDETENKKAKRTIGLPKYEILKKENWISRMNEESAVLYIKDFDSYKYYINIDNSSLKDKLDSLKDETDKEMYKQMYIYMMLFMAISVNNKKMSKDENNNNGDEIAVVTKEYAKFMFIGEKLMDDLKNKLG